MVVVERRRNRLGDVWVSRIGGGSVRVLGSGSVRVLGSLNTDRTRRRSQSFSVAVGGCFLVLFRSHSSSLIALFSFAFSVRDPEMV